MSGLLPQGLQYNLGLADGSRWAIAAGDEAAAAIIARLSDAMQLRVAGPSVPPALATVGSSGTVAVKPPHHDIARRLLVMVDAHNPDGAPAMCYAPLPREDDGSVVYVLRSFPESAGLYIQFTELSLIFAHDSQTRGGVLLHGALAEKDGVGVILAAPGGTGKTTASDRLPAPWHSRCDDATLVVRDSHGDYWAHPWPTWSRFLWGRSGGTWDVQNALPLAGVFFLSRATEDRVESVGSGRAASLLVECAGQTTQLMARGLGKEETRVLHLERFNNICALARVVPTHILRISLTGVFWQEIERAL